MDWISFVSHSASCFAHLYGYSSEWRGFQHRKAARQEFQIIKNAPDPPFLKAVD
jgi:hypothetical protein